MTAKVHTWEDIERRRRVYDFIKNNPETFCKEISEHIGVKSHFVAADLRCFADLGFVEVTQYRRVPVVRKCGKRCSAKVAAYIVIAPLDESMYDKYGAAMLNSYKRKRKYAYEAEDHNREPAGRLVIEEKEKGYYVVRFGREWRPSSGQSTERGLLRKSSLEYS